jgi:alpha-ketoglutarate-dependent taurine dioxygenase
MQVNRLSDFIGAEVLGVDLKGDGLAGSGSSNAAGEPGEDQALTRALEDALNEHIVLVIRDQDLTPGQYVRAMRRFGKPTRQNHVDQLMSEHPEIWVMDSSRAHLNDAGEPILFGANSWHTDHTNLERPPKITALYAVQLPPSGGDTCFANAYRLYEHLPEQTQLRVEEMRTINGADRHLPTNPADRAAFETPAVHPLARTHPVTGRKALYCHPLKVQCIEGMLPEESFQFIDDLMETAIKIEEAYRHRWQPGDLVMIDNRACLHRAMKNYDHRLGRIMHRICIEGERPV